MSVYSDDPVSTYYATAGDNKVVTASTAKLHRIIVGKAVNSAVIEVSDHATDGDGNVVIHLEGNSLGPNVYEVDAVFEKGISADSENQTYVTFVWSK